MRAFVIVVAVTVTVPFIANLTAQTHTVALTIDDLPFVQSDANSGTLHETDKQAAAANHKLLNALARHHVPVTGFVIQKGVEDLGMLPGAAILRNWAHRGFDLGNHTYAHPDFNDLTVEQFEDQILRGEATFVPLMKAEGRKPEFFRFPFNHTGDTREKHNALAAFLAKHGYRQAPCTIETSDYMFAAAYGRMLARHDEGSAARLRADYLSFTAAQIDYFIGLNKRVWGYDAPQIMLIHDNQLNADVIEDLLDLFERKQFHWISLSEAEADPAYQEPEIFITKFGPMWGYRWAKERGVKYDGSLEPDPPKWVSEYMDQNPIPPRRPRSGF
ncbi:MAG: polysaccharide deacetylase family protein [Terracidiphilus sp.]|jgi:peptidoglycan/xylan/chitin deacetylase (PgdA/CDA1 family)